MTILLNNQDRKNGLKMNSQIILPQNKDFKIQKTDKHAQRLQEKRKGKKKTFPIVPGGYYCMEKH